MGLEFLKFAVKHFLRRVKIFITYSRLMNLRIKLILFEKSGRTLCMTSKKVFKVQNFLEMKQKDMYSDFRLEIIGI